MGLSKQERDYWYPKIVRHYHKESCNGCGVIIYPTFAKVLPDVPILISKLNLNYWVNSTHGKRLCSILYIDHINNDSSLNNIQNLQLLCPSCNVIKNPKKSSQIITRDMTPEMKRGFEQEQAFREYIRKEVIKNDWILVEEDAINGGSEYLTDFDDGNTISPTTCKRYLNKMISKNGLYTIHGKYLTFKYKEPQLDEWLQKISDSRDIAIKKRQDLSKSYTKS